MNGSAPEVTVVIPTRNRSRMVREHALASALAQEDVSLEVVVVDDASTDDTVAALAAMPDERVRVVRHEQSRGASAARNTGIAAARGTWVALLDDDDLWSPRKLRTQLDAAARATAGWAYGRSVAVDDRLDPTGFEEPPPPERLAQLLLHRNVMPAGDSNVLIRTDLIRRVGGFDERLSSFEDWDLWIRLAQESRAAACTEVVVARVAHDARPVPSARTAVAQLRFMLGKHRRVDPADVRAALEWLGERHARSGHRIRAAALFLRVAARYGSPGNAARALAAITGRGAEPQPPAVLDSPGWLAAFGSRA
jgi:glycosyltransferase involved in cell wall biosynthesis